MYNIIKVMITMIKLKLKEILAKRNKSIYWLSQKTGITYPALHNLVTKQPRTIYFDTLEKIMEVLDIDDFNNLFEKQ